MKKIILALTGLGIAYALNAQSLPSTQTSSVLLSNPTKADGVFDEIQGKLQAYNKSTSVYYTIANNDQTLYLAIQVTDPSTFRKIIGGGISFTICATGDKAQPDPVVITYPLIAQSFKGVISNLFNNYSAEKTDSAAHDEMLTYLNKTLSDQQKEIGVKGIKEIDDKQISIYNTNGIKANTVVSKDGKMYFELILPLKLIGLDQPHQTMAYNIMLNGISAATSEKIITAPDGSTVTVSNVPHGLTQKKDNYQDLLSPTDFWAKYTLY